jgi:hypothetical protein
MRLTNKCVGYCLVQLEVALSAGREAMASSLRLSYITHFMPSLFGRR